MVEKFNIMIRNYTPSNVIYMYNLPKEQVYNMRYTFVFMPSYAFYKTTTKIKFLPFSDLGKPKTKFIEINTLKV